MHGTININNRASHLQRLYLWVESYLNVDVSKFCLMKQLNLLHSKHVIAAVDVSKIKVNFVLCYWACILYATHMINVDLSSRNHGSIQEARKYIFMNKSCVCKIYQNPERPGLANLLRVRAHIVYKFGRNSLMCPWQFWRSHKGLGVFHNYY